jgi:hypothetical protein
LGEGEQQKVKQSDGRRVDESSTRPTNANTERSGRVSLEHADAEYGKQLTGRVYVESNTDYTQITNKNMDTRIQ